MTSETCRKCRGSLRFNPNVKIGSRATDYDNCHAYCDVCRIGISNSRDRERRTYICEILADNLADPQSEERYLQVMERALNQRNRKNKIRRAKFEKSEDTLTWSVFSHLEKRGLMAVAARTLTGVAWNDPVDVLYWGYNDQGPETLREQLIAVPKGLGESARSFSEPDLILHAPQTGLVFVEVNYAPPKRSSFELRKAKRYLEAGADHLQPDCGGMQHYELLRNWVIGCSDPLELDNYDSSSRISPRKGKHYVKAPNVYTGVQGSGSPGRTERRQGQSRNLPGVPAEATSLLSLERGIPETST
jgi:hypothetical protein